MRIFLLFLLQIVLHELQYKQSKIKECEKKGCQYSVPTSFLSVVSQNLIWLGMELQEDPHHCKA